MRGDSNHGMRRSLRRRPGREFIRALQVQLREMTSRLTWIECQGVTGRSSREMRLEAAALRRDIQEARVLIDRLQRRYLGDDGPRQALRLVRYQAR